MRKHAEAALFAAALGVAVPVGCWLGGHAVMALANVLGDVVYR